MPRRLRLILGGERGRRLLRRLNPRALPRQPIGRSLRRRRTHACEATNGPAVAFVANFVRFWQSLPSPLPSALIIGPTPGEWAPLPESPTPYASADLRAQRVRLPFRARRRREKFCRPNPFYLIFE